MKNIPTTEVQIWDHNDKTVSIKLITLMAWTTGFDTVPAIEGYARKLLSVPADYPSAELKRHLEISYASLKHQFKTGEFNYEPNQEEE